MVCDLKAVGAKARSLIKLSQAGFPVPLFHVIPFSVYKEAQNESLNIPSSYRGEFNELLKRFSDSRVAVRSSASKEDGESASFAGLFESFLDVKGAQANEEAVKKCWHSRQTERTQKYCERNKINATELEMAVIVQEDTTMGGGLGPTYPWSSTTANAEN